MMALNWENLKALLRYVEQMENEACELGKPFLLIHDDAALIDGHITKEQIEQFLQQAAQQKEPSQ